MIMMPFPAAQPGPVTPAPTGPNPPPRVNPNCPGFCISGSGSGTSTSCQCSTSAALDRGGVCTCEDGSAPIKNAQCDAECNKPTGGVQGSSLTFGQNGFDLEMGYQPYMNYNRMIMMPAAQPGPVTPGPVAPGPGTPTKEPTVTDGPTPTAAPSGECTKSCGDPARGGFYYTCQGQAICNVLMTAQCTCDGITCTKCTPTGPTTPKQEPPTGVVNNRCICDGIPAECPSGTCVCTANPQGPMVHSCSDGSTPNIEGGVQGSSLTFGPSGFGVEMGYRPVSGAAYLNRMNAGYEPETTTQGL